MKRYHKPKKVKQPNVRPVTIFWGILCLAVSIILCCLLLMTISSFVGNKLDILKYTKDSQIIDGVVRTVSTAWVNNPGKYDWDYTLDSVVVAYNNEQGEEILFTSDKYRKSWDVAQNIKLIAKPTDMDIAYFDVITFRYAPMQLKQSAIPYLSLSIFLIMLIWYFSMYGLELLRAPVRLEDSVKAKHEKKTKDLKDIDTVETNTKKADAKEKNFKNVDSKEKDLKKIISKKAGFKENRMKKAENKEISIEEMNIPMAKYKLKNCSEKEYQLSQTKIILGFFTVVMCLVFITFFLVDFGILNPVTTYWNQAVIGASSYAYLEDDNGSIEEIYKYDCHFTTKWGESKVGYINDPKGERTSGEQITFLCYEGMEVENELCTPFDLVGYFIMPVLFLAAYLVAKALHWKALKEMKLAESVYQQVYRNSRMPRSYYHK